MDSSYQLLLTIGGILLLGLLTSVVARHTFLLGCIASATAPAAVLDVVTESGGETIRICVWPQ